MYLNYIKYGKEVRTQRLSAAVTCMLLCLHMCACTSAQTRRLKYYEIENVKL